MLRFLPKSVQNYYIPNPSDSSFETLNNFKRDCNMDVFFALSHGVNFGGLRSSSNDEREVFLNKLLEKGKNINLMFLKIMQWMPISIYVIVQALILLTTIIVVMELSLIHI